MRTTGCLSSIMRHISNMKYDEIFTTRDCLQYGKRSNVDNALFRAVKSGFIVRLARGVFMRRSTKFVFPSALEIATAKARAFGKQILAHGAGLAHKLKVGAAAGTEMCTKAGTEGGTEANAEASTEANAKPCAEPTYYVSGSSSSFRYRNQRIHFKRACPKLMHLPDDRLGLTLRALCHLGKQWVQTHGVNDAFGWWCTRIEKETVHRSKAWMPAWLADHFVTTHYYGPFPITKSSNP